MEKLEKLEIIKERKIEIGKLETETERIAIEKEKEALEKEKQKK